MRPVRSPARMWVKLFKCRRKSMLRTLCLALAGAAVCALASPVSADETINLSKCEAITTTAVHDFALDALTKRKYAIASDTPSSVVGELDKFKVEIAIEA